MSARQVSCIEPDYRVSVMRRDLEDQTYEPAVSHTEGLLDEVKARSGRARGPLRARLGLYPPTMCAAYRVLPVTLERVVPEDLVRATVEAAMHSAAGETRAIPMLVATRPPSSQAGT